MRIDILTLFPGMFEGPLTESIIGRAADAGLVDIHYHDIRDFAIGNYRQVDDKPYGGGAGMVMRADVLVEAIESVQKQEKSLRPHRIYLSPRGKRLDQQGVEEYAKKEWIIMLCGHYEGIDQRVIDGGWFDGAHHKWIDEEVSIGDYVLTGGELPAMVLVDAVARQIPGVLGKEESAEEESFSAALDRKKEYPHYTRPEEFKGLKVPDVLLSGHHGEIEKWRKEQLS